VSTFDYPVCVLPYVPSEENKRFADEYSAKWREESMSWKELEAALRTDPLEIAEADIAETEGRAAIRMFGFLNGERYDDQHCKIYLRGGQSRRPAVTGRILACANSWRWGTVIGNR
jgi:hypothetical protein